MNTNTAPATYPAIVAGMRLKLVKGCAARGLAKGITVYVESVKEMGPDFSHSVRVVIKPLNGFQGGKTFAFHARHVNRLSDLVVRMNDGNPLHTIEVRRA